MDYLQLQKKLDVCDPNDYPVQYTLRITILSIAFLSSCFIFYVCIAKRLRKFWTFKLLLVQSGCEMTDLFLAILFDQEVVSQEIMENWCFLVGYIMHSSWVSSFICCFLMVYVHKTIFKMDNTYQRITSRINYILIGVLILPYIYLLYPMLKHHFVPTGWHAKNAECKQYFFCGFDSTLWVYIVFWTIPQIFIFGYACKIIINNRKKVNESQCVTDMEELQFIKKIQNIPVIYIIAWFVNQLVRYVDLFPQFQEIVTQNEIPYILYLIFNLGFELHLCVVLGCFIYYYRKVKNVKFCWPFQRHKFKDNEEGSLIYQISDSLE